MKLCITASGSDLESTTDASFGRAPWLLLVDTDTLAVEAVKNSSASARQGAGIAAAQLVADHGAEVLLTGRVGPKAGEALQAAGIRVNEGLGRYTVREALRRFQEGEFSGTGNGRSGPRAEGGPGGCGCRGRGQGMGRRQGMRGRQG